MFADHSVTKDQGKSVREISRLCAVLIFNIDTHCDTNTTMSAQKRGSLSAQASSSSDTKVSIKSTSSEVKVMVNQRVKPLDIESGTHRYSISRLLHIGCRNKSQMNLAQFSVEAIQGMSSLRTFASPTSDRKLSISVSLAFLYTNSPSYHEKFHLPRC